MPGRLTINLLAYTRTQPESNPNKINNWRYTKTKPDIWGHMAHYQPRNSQHDSDGVNTKKAAKRRKTMRKRSNTDGMRQPGIVPMIYQKLNRYTEAVVADQRTEKRLSPYGPETSTRKAGYNYIWWRNGNVRSCMHWWPFTGPSIQDRTFRCVPNISHISNELLRNWGIRYAFWNGGQ